MNPKNCISYWFPRLTAAGLPVPATIIMDAGEDWFEMPDTSEGLGTFADLVARIEPPTATIGTTAPTKAT